MRHKQVVVYVKPSNNLQGIKFYQIPMPLNINILRKPKVLDRQRFAFKFVQNLNEYPL